MPRNIYRLSTGEIVPGCTTICDQLGKGDGITNWAHKIAYESTVDLIKRSFNAPSRRVGELTIPDYNGIQKWQSVRDSAGDIGTLVHELVLDFLSGEEITLEDKDDVVVNCFRKFKKWWAGETKDYVPELIIEQPLVSEKLGFGGQPDIYIVNKQRLDDVKTSNGIYDSYWLQLAGYAILLEENGYKVREFQIPWLPKDDRFDAPIRIDLRKEKKIFKYLLGIWKLRNEREC